MLTCCLCHRLFCSKVFRVEEDLLFLFSIIFFVFDCFVCLGVSKVSYNNVNNCLFGL